MAKLRQVGLRLDADDDMGLKRVAQREGRSEQDILRDSLRRYVRTADERKNFISSVERGWYELRSGLGESVTGDDDFFESVRREIRSEDASMPAIIPKAPWRIASVRPLPGFRLSVRFNDGKEGTVAMAGLIHSPNAGVFAVLQDEELFSKVALHYGAVTWPGELDLAPDAMYEAISRGGEYVLL